MKQFSLYKIWEIRFQFKELDKWLSQDGMLFYSF